MNLDGKIDRINVSIESGPDDCRPAPWSYSYSLMGVKPTAENTSEQASVFR